MRNCIIVLKKGLKSFSIKQYPTVGEFLEIEQNKIRLSGGLYGQMAASKMVSMQYALDLIDAISTFSVLGGKSFNDSLKQIIPETGNVMDMPALFSKQLVDQYTKNFIPWYKDFLTLLYQEVENDIEDIGEDIEEKN